MSEIPLADRVLDSRTLVKGIVYCIEHTASGKQYVGQTVTHRLNKGKYRPYGTRRRFAEHCSNASRNTKPSQSTCLYNAIREFGPAGFTIHTLEECEIVSLDVRERYWIDQQSSLHPLGFNLTTGGAKAFEIVATVEKPPLNPAGKRGGCTHRSAETRARMSAGVKAVMGTPAAKKVRSEAAVSQHSAKKAAQFAGVAIDPSNLDQYLTIRTSVVLVKVGSQVTRFYGKIASQEELVARAKAFLMSLPKTTESSSSDTITHVSDTTTEYAATLPNCSGNP